jgi:hypothetical protein
MAQQTAVEWLKEQYDSCPPYEQFLGESEWEQALEMEKKQIENAFNYGVYDGGGLIKKYKMSGEIYYNETFKSE